MQEDKKLGSIHFEPAEDLNRKERTIEPKTTEQTGLFSYLNLKTQEVTSSFSRSITFTKGFRGPNYVWVGLSCFLSVLTNTLSAEENDDTIVGERV